MAPRNRPNIAQQRIERQELRRDLSGANRLKPAQKIRDGIAATMQFMQPTSAPKAKPTNMSRATSGSLHSPDKRRVQETRTLRPAAAHERLNGHIEDPDQDGKYGDKKRLKKETSGNCKIQLEADRARMKIANRIAPRRSPRPSFVFLRAKKIPPIIASKKKRLPAITMMSISPAADDRFCLRVPAPRAYDFEADRLALKCSRFNPNGCSGPV